MRLFLLAVIVLSVPTGCTRYYRVSDPASGREYYTSNIKRGRGGFVRFRDLRDRREVTLQSSEILRLRRDDLPEEVPVKR